MGSEKVRLTGSGDCSAAHSGWALKNPPWRSKGGQKVCFRCSAWGKDWINEQACKLAWQRTFTYQCVANHRNPYPFLPGCDSNGQLYSERPPPKCPHCHVTVDEALMEKEEAERQAAPNRKAANELENNHAASHAGGLAGRIPVLPMDNKWRSRGLLHRRMNIASNCMMATFLWVKFVESQRIAANALLQKHKMIYRFPETPGKRAKTISAGNDSRRLFSNSELLVGLLKIFYPAEAALHMEALDQLAGEADANAAVRTEEGARDDSEPAPAAQKPRGVAGGITKNDRGKKKAAKKVQVVLAPGGARVDKAAVKEYAARRKAADRAVGGNAPAPAPAEEGQSPEDEDKEGDTGDDSLQLEPEDGDMEDELEEDARAGNLGTAIEVWLTAIRYTEALHASVANAFDDVEVRAYASVCAKTGKKWAVKINEHTSNRAMWQYVHDAFCHIEEDILVNGPLDRNDDAILEKGNRRKKRLGDRCTMRGGKNCAADGGKAVWTQTRRVKIRDENGKFTGEYRKKTVTRRANLGVAAQVLKLDLIAQLCESKRASATVRKSAGQVEFDAEQKALRQERREATENAMVKASLQIYAPSFFSTTIDRLPDAEREAMVELEKRNMKGYQRNGDVFEAYFERADLTVHTATSAEGELYGFAISGAEATRGKFFLYELHVSKVARNCGIGTMLLSSVEKYTQTQHRAGKAAAVELELQVHEGNQEALSFYKKVEFVEVGKTADGMVIMRRKRATR